MTMLPFGQVAPISRRVVAYIIDGLIASVLAFLCYGALFAFVAMNMSQGIVSMILLGGPLASLPVLGWFIAYTMMQGDKGSIGMRAQGLRLVRLADGAPLGFGRALRRNIIFNLAGSIIVGYFTPLFDSSGRFQGWHDKAAGSVMMDARVAAPVEAPVVEAPAPPPPPLLPAPSFERLPPAPMPGFAPAGPAPLPVMTPAAESPQPFARPVVPSAPVADSGSLIAFVPGVTQDSPPPRPAAPPAAPVRTAEPTAPLPVEIPERPAVPSAVPPVPPVAAPFPPVAPPAPSATLNAEPPAQAAAVQPASDVDDIEDTRISIPGHRLVFTWDDGTRVSVSRRTLFGRNPAPEVGSVIVPVRDETLSLSKTHFEAAAEVTGGWVLDRHSTNGMTIVREGLRIACPPGERIAIRLGDVIEIGDRVVTIGGYV